MKRLIAVLAAMAITLSACSCVAAATPLREHNKHNYLAEMIDCAVQGQTSKGRRLAIMRKAKQKLLKDTSPQIEYDDLFLLGKVIEHEAGCSWLSLEWKTMVGEVVMNRVESPEFPDTISKVVYQKGQYSGTNNKKFNNMLPSKASATAAANLLQGQRLLNNKAVVFQANFKLGSGVHTKLVDKKLGTTYLCYSYHRELYT